MHAKREFLRGNENSLFKFVRQYIPLKTVNNKCVQTYTMSNSGMSDVCDATEVQEIYRSRVVSAERVVLRSGQKKGL
jgi:hypothetical protein